ncbi:MAG TPA: ferritin-like domain-containing protein [Gemmatimonadaceae bacterium]|nr:ferritin-like domain-containing protein [Gemmatimonadaceae bacterium]
MELDTLKELYIDELKDLYSAEQQILKSMPKMIRKASNPKLQRAFTTHMRQTERQIKRLERVARLLGEAPGGKKCIGMKGLIDEVKELIDEKPEPEVLDAGLISKAQHIEHYEMAGYGTVRTYARLLGYEEQADLLQQTLDEEGETDHLLTALSESINVEAMAPEGEEEDEEEMAPARKRGTKRGAKRGRGTASKKRTSRRGAASRGALARHKSGNLHDRAKALIGG